MEGTGRKVCIVGAGLSGLVCGMRLAKAGFDVDIVEELTYAGGLLASTRVGNEYIALPERSWGISPADSQVLSTS